MLTFKAQSTVKVTSHIRVKHKSSPVITSKSLTHCAFHTYITLYFKRIGEQKNERDEPGWETLARQKNRWQQARHLRL